MSETPIWRGAAWCADCGQHTENALECETCRMRLCWACSHKRPCPGCRALEDR